MSKTRKYPIQVRNKESGEIVEVIRRVIRAEQIGNFNPFFCTYRGDKRCLIKSDVGDVSDPFRRDAVCADTFHILI